MNLCFVELKMKDYFKTGCFVKLMIKIEAKGTNIQAYGWTLKQAPIKEGMFLGGYVSFALRHSQLDFNQFNFCRQSRKTVLWVSACNIYKRGLENFEMHV